jgi:hypothetical protein
MGELQRLTHKLALSADAGNAELIRFYLYESLELLDEIQTDIPLYDDLPIALLIDQLARPAYGQIAEKLSAGKVTVADVEAVVDSCNQCHASTQHPFIKITADTSVNPFSQDFQP